MNISALSANTQTLAPIASPVSTGQAAENRKLIQTIQAINASQLPGENRELTFSLDRATHQPVISIIDVKTKEVVQQVPAEYLLQMRKDFDSNAK